jgi:hypothetical protein
MLWWTLEAMLQPQVLLKDSHCVVNRAIGIGGRVAPPPLPHHRTCGSASGGSAA